MTMTGDNDQDGPPSGAPKARAAVEELVEAGLLDELMAKVDRGELQLTGEGGFLPEMIKAVLERGLAAELTEHLGYEKGDPAGRGSPNSRNGTTPKTLVTEVGDVALATPRDRAGTFEPRLVPKGVRRAGGLDDMIISLYAGGMTVRDIQHHLARTIGTDLSPDTISTITDAGQRNGAVQLDQEQSSSCAACAVAGCAGRGGGRCAPLRPVGCSGRRSCATTHQPRWRDYRGR